MGAGSLDIELAGPAFDLNLDIEQYDRLRVTQHAQLDGLIEVTLLDGFVPAYEDAFDVLTAAGGFDGFFADAIPLSSGLPGELGFSSGIVDVDSLAGAAI